MTKGQLKPNTPQCTATSRQTKKQCTRPPLKGSHLCEQHGALTPNHHKKAQFRAALQDYTLEKHPNPIETAEQCLGLTQYKLAKLNHLLAQQETATEQNLEQTEQWKAAVRTLVGIQKAVTTSENGEDQTVVLGEYRRELAKAEAEERDRLMNFSKVAVQIGLETRKQALAEKYAENANTIIDKLIAVVPAEYRPAMEEKAQQILLDLARQAQTPDGFGSDIEPLPVWSERPMSPQERYRQGKRGVIEG